MRRGWWLAVALLAATALSAWLTATHLSVTSDLSTLFPNTTEAGGLARYARAFGGGDLAVVLVQGKDPEAVSRAAGIVTEVLREAPSVESVLDRPPEPSPPDPTLAWAFAGPSAREALAQAITPEGMRARLDGTRDLLLAPGAAAAETWLARDPLRLSILPWENAPELAAGVAGSAGAGFVADQGRARLVIAEPRGSAFDGAAAAAFVRDAGAAMARARSEVPSVTTALTGGHAIAQATKALLIRDLEVSGTLSLVLASAVFVLAFQRARALVAVLPPLALGTLWTTALAALAPGSLSAIAIAFTAVVVGVGVDTGVHVYAALLEARRRGLPSAEAARWARARAARPTLLAAVAAGAAFASLAWSSLHAMRQLGLLCAAGEVLTAVAILLVTPAIGAWLERGDPPPIHRPRWLDAVRAATSTRTRAGVALACALVPVALLGLLPAPRNTGAVVALRPRAAPPIATQERIYELFGGRPGQWVVLSIDADRQAAAARADAVAEALDPLRSDGTIQGFDALAEFAPAPATQRKRLAARGALDLPGRQSAFRDALIDRGFDPEACAAALASFAHPTDTSVAVPDGRNGPLAWLVARHLARDGSETLAATYVRPRGEPHADARALAAIHAADPRAIVTGYPYLEQSLRDALQSDLPRVALVALVLVAIALRAVLRRTWDVALALLTVVSEVAAVLLLMRAAHVRWHVYDALVLPVLVGVTIDEATFLLNAARRTGCARGDAVARALSEQGPLVASTALTTAAGFAALLACRFDGLFDLGAVGALGALLGLAAALLVVPAGLRLARGTDRDP